MLRLAPLILVLTVSACGFAGDSRDDKAGGARGPVVLRLANTNGQLDFTPAVADFARRVRKLSGGELRIESVDHWGDSSSQPEQQVVRDVAAGAIDLGWVGSRVFDTLGVKSFQALTAPLLIDSYALEGAIVEDGITGEMTRALADLGVAGLGVLPDGLRRPIGVAGPIAGPADWRGITFGSHSSDGQAEAIRALGATPVQPGRSGREQQLRDGVLQGFETSIWVHQHNPALIPLAPYVTANLTLWPQMDVLLADPSRMKTLTTRQRGWLRAAARDAAAHAPALLAATDTKALSDSCGAGARYAQASDADRAGLEAAFAPVYADLRGDPETKAFIDRIRALKQSTPAEAELTIPAGCTGKAPERTGARTGTAPARLNGTYRYVLTKADGRRVGDPEIDALPAVVTWTLEDGRVVNPEGMHGSYSVTGDRLTFQFAGFDTPITLRLRVGDDGTLHLTPVPPIDAGDAFLLAYKPWTKIG